MTFHYLNNLFIPRSVAVVGASERPDSLGRHALNNLSASGYRGELIAVNPKYQSVGGLPCYSSLHAIGRPVDLALIATPATSVIGLLDDAGRAGVRNAVVLSAGFGETGATGRALERDLIDAARRNQVRMIGPNCLGIMRPAIGLNASFSRGNARSGSIALVSQSGAVVTSLVDWASQTGIGFSSVISMGAGIDIDFGEILDFLAFDPDTRSILLYIEGVRDARRFISGLRAAARAKPIMVLKVGRHLDGSRAAMSHTGALAGNDAVFDAVLRRCGVVRVRTYAELFAAAELIAGMSGYSTRGDVNRLAIVTNGGGPGVLAADFAVDAGVSLASLSGDATSALNAGLPAHWSHANPIDILGDADASRLRRTLDIVLADESVDAVLTLFCPQQVMPARDAAEAIIATVTSKDGLRKPVLTAWLGATEVREGRESAERAHLAVFDSPESAVAAFGALGEYSKAQRMLMEVPLGMKEQPRTGKRAMDIREQAHLLARVALNEGRTLLSEPESKRLLSLFNIATPPTVVAKTLPEAIAAARSMSYPLAIKIVSPDIAHKSDVGGVSLNIRDDEGLARSFDALMARTRSIRPDARIEGIAVQPMVEKRFGRELLIGVATDPVFGRVLSFGTGGVAVELMRDTVIGLPPLSRTLAADMVSRTRAARLLGAYRHIPAVMLDSVLDVLLRVSEMVCLLPWLAEMDINPLLADESGCVALDARIVIDDSRLSGDSRQSHLAIRPYPLEWESDITLPDAVSSKLRIRPIRPEDASLELAFVENLSDRTRHLRFFGQARGLTPKLLARFTQVDYDRELALIALPRDKEHPMLGVARYSPNPDGVSCEFAVTVADDWQGRGLGYQLMTRLIEAAGKSGYTAMTGSVLASNSGMLDLARFLGFRLRRNEAAEIIDVEKQLG